MKYADLSEKFEQFSKREKVLVAATALVLMIVLFYTAFIEGLAAKVAQSEQQLKSARDMQVKIEQQINHTQQSLKLSPSEAIEAKIVDHQAQLKILKDELQQSSIQVVSVQQLARFNQKITTPESAIKLQSVQFDTLQYQQDDETEESTSNLAKCETKLQLQGSKQQLFDYLAFLEKQPVGIYWSKLSYQQLKDQQVQLDLGFYVLCAN